MSDDIAKKAGIALALKEWVKTDGGRFAIEAYRRINGLIADKIENDNFERWWRNPTSREERQVCNVTMLSALDLRNQLAAGKWGQALDCLISPVLEAERFIKEHQVIDPADPVGTERRLGMLGTVRALVLSVADLGKIVLEESKP